MLITQFDTDPILMNISERHHAWHTYPTGAHGFPSRTIAQGQPGSGTEFLTFHRNLVNEFFTWNNVHHAATGTQLAAWSAVPAILKSDSQWTAALQADETHIATNSPAIPTADALGILIETTIHNWIHGAVGRSSFPMDAGESTVISGFHSVKSTYFYEIHGLVQYWWDQWLHRKGIITKRLVDSVINKHHIKEFLKEHVKENIKEILPEGKHFKEIKEKDIVEHPGIHIPEQPIEAINSLRERIAALENTVKGGAFIKNEERPEVTAKNK